MAQPGVSPTTDLPSYEETLDAKRTSGARDILQSPPDGSLLGGADESDAEKQKVAEGRAYFRRLGWKRLTIVLVVEAIALGSLSIPKAFARLGMIPGIICCLLFGLISIYTSYVVGQVKVKFPHVSHYADAGRLMFGRFGRFGYELTSAMFVVVLVLLVGGHCLVGTIAFEVITGKSVCSVVFSIVSAIVLLLLAIPPSFAEVAILGYIDFASILLAIGITMVATASHSGGTATSSGWSAWAPAPVEFHKSFLSITNIIFSYSFTTAQFSFMDEMHTPTDFVKSIWTLGIMQTVIYTLTGALIYTFVGPDLLPTQTALETNPPIVSKVAFGVAFPVIFISGSINTTVVARYIHGRIYKDSVIQFINTWKGWATWLGLIAAITAIAWVVSEAVPIFMDLLSFCASLFITGFTYYFPAFMWFKLIKEGKWHALKNIIPSVANAIIFVLGLVVLFGGSYATVVDIVSSWTSPASLSAS